MATVIVRHKVGNFNTWLAGHKDRMNVFSLAVKSIKTFRDANDPNSIAMILEVNDMEKMNQLMTDPSIQHYKDKHTVIDPISVYMQVEV